MGGNYLPFRKGEYEIALKKAEKNLENFPNDLIAYLLLLQAQHRIGDFKACEKPI